MKIDRHEALALAKILEGYVDLDTHAPSDRQRGLNVLAQRIDDFLTHDDVRSDESDEEVDDYVKPADGCYDDDEDSQEDDDAKEVTEVHVHDRFVSRGDLHALKPSKSSEGALEFEDVGRSKTVVLLLEGFQDYGFVDTIIRKARSLHVSADGSDYTVYHVSRFPSAWVKLLPVNEVIGVCD